MMPAEGGPNICKPKSSCHQRRRSEILAVSLKHWKGRRGFRWGVVCGRSNTSLGVRPHESGRSKGVGGTFGRLTTVFTHPPGATIATTQGHRSSERHGKGGRCESVRAKCTGVWGKGAAGVLGVTALGFLGVCWRWGTAGCEMVEGRRAGRGGGGWHNASVSDCLPLAAPMGLWPLLILTLCGPERVLVVSTEPPDDLSCLTTPGVGCPGDGLLPVPLTRGIWMHTPSPGGGGGG